MSKEKQKKDEIDKIDIILYKSYESDIGIGKEYYNYIMKFINNQQKEIEELKEKNKQLTNYLTDSYYVSADEIREKIKEYEEKYNNYPKYTPEDFEFRQEYLHKLVALEELLEEK